MDKLWHDAKPQYLSSGEAQAALDAALEEGRVDGGFVTDTFDSTFGELWIATASKGGRTLYV